MRGQIHKDLIHEQLNEILTVEVTDANWQKSVGHFE